MRECMRQSRVSLHCDLVAGFLEKSAIVLSFVSLEIEFRSYYMRPRQVVERRCKNRRANPVLGKYSFLRF